VARLFGARDEFHLEAIVQNLKTLANRIWRPLPNKLAASQSRPCSQLELAAPTRSTLVYQIGMMPQVVKRTPNLMTAAGDGLPSRLRWHHDRCAPDSGRLAAPPKSAGSAE
jgi:hypothetical protein